MIAVDEPLFWHYQGNTEKLVDMIKIHVEKLNEIYSRGPIIYFFDGRSPSRHKQTQFLYLAGGLIEHFLEGIAPLRHWYINPNEKSN